MKRNSPNSNCPLIVSLMVLLAFSEQAIAQVGHPNVDLHAEALKFRQLKLKDEKGEIPADAWLKAAAQKKQMRFDPLAWPNSPRQDSPTRREAGLSPAPLVAGIQSSGWTWLGPGNIGGRVRSILIHPTTPSTMWVGSVGGGVWKTLNSGASWFPLDDFMANLAISCMVMDPANPDIIYAGTGEALGAGDGIQGAGVFETTDGGATWAQLPSTTSPNFRFVNRLAISPADSQVILAATATGIFRSTDSGVSWSKRNGSFTHDLAFDPSDGSKCIASGFGSVRFSTDGGVTWTTANGISGASRIEIAYAPSLPVTVYASANKTNGEVYRSLDGGQTYSLRNTGTSYLEAQGDYDNCVWVDPTNPNTLIVGGIDLWRSTDGGATLARISNWQLAPTFSAHADHHVIVNHPNYNGANNRTVFFGNDGGIYRATDAGSGWTELNNNLGITEFYGVAGNAAGGFVVAGAQDNGTVHLTKADGTDAWTERWGGDGGFCAADPTDARFFYGEYVWLQIHRSTEPDGYISGGISDSGGDPGTNANFIAPFILDPNSPSTMLAGGRSLWRSVNVKSLFPGWSRIKQAISGTASISTVGISAIAVAPGNSDVVWVGHNNGDIFATSDGTAASPTWTRKDLSTPNLPNRFCTRIAIDPHNASLVYVTFGGFSSSNVWRTTDGGTTWTDISNNLPDAPVNSLVIDPNISSLLYIGTEVGVFASADGGSNWSPNNDGPANVAVDELAWIGIYLVAATHGRGCFSIVPTIWVDFSFPCFICGAGSFDDPFNTLGQARGYVSAGGTIRIKAGSSGNCCDCSPPRDCFPITITEAMRIEAFGGPVTIGR
jgi:photosystem II stability/assembly factor-like uncharacterized protein